MGPEQTGRCCGNARRPAQGKFGVGGGGGGSAESASDKHAWLLLESHQHIFSNTEQIICNEFSRRYGSDLSLA